MKESFYLYKSGRIKRKDNTLEVIYKDNSKRVLPIERINDLYLMSEFDLNTELLNYISKYGINIHFFNYYGFYTGTYYPKENLVSGNLLIKQANSYIDSKKKNTICKRIYI